MMVTPLTKAIHDTETNLTKKETGSCTFSNKQPTILSDPERPYRPVGKLRLDLHTNFIDAFVAIPLRVEIFFGVTFYTFRLRLHA